MTDLRQTAPRPPATLSVRYCSECGQDDRFKNLKPRHYHAGRLCPGPLVIASYRFVGYRKLEQ